MIAATNLNQNMAKNRRINWKNPALYKTRLCDYWSTGNPCKFGLNCWYAHGPVELRHVPRLDKDPVATSISLAEVLQKLPPSRDFFAVEQAETQLMANMRTDAFMKQAFQEVFCPAPTPVETPTLCPTTKIEEDYKNWLELDEILAVLEQANEHTTPKQPFWPQVDPDLLSQTSLKDYSGFRKDVNCDFGELIRDLSHS